MKVILRRPDRGYLDTHLWVPRVFIDVEGTKRALSYEFQGYGGTSQYVYLWQEAEHHLLLPRAFWPPAQLAFPVVDCRPRSYQHVPFGSRIQLDHLPQELGGSIQLLPTGRDVQQRSMAALMASPTGILQLACGRGKTVIALEKIARGQVPAIVMLDNTNLLYQWQKEAEDLLDIPGGVGIIADGKKQWKKGLVLATYHSIANWSETMPEEVRRWFGQVFWDEGHHVSAPTFAKTAGLFYGNRYSLTATPNRDDGMHVIADAHIGKVLYKDLTPMMLPRFAFVWTDHRIDATDPTVAAQVLDQNKEVHLKKVYSYFGQWRSRLNIILSICHEALSFGRRVLVLSDSVGEVVNLYAAWCGHQGGMYTDIPMPTPLDIGETLQPCRLSDRDHHKLETYKTKLTKQYKKQQEKDPSSPLLTQWYTELVLIDQALKQHEIHRRLDNELKKSQKKYVDQLLQTDGPAGFLTFGVPPARRQSFLAEKQLNFSITKYGKEGLDCQELDTVILSSLFASSNSLQQLMGRPTRPMPGKKSPLIVFLVDDVGQCIGMSKKLQAHLRSWPKEEGGPYEPILVNHPAPWTFRKSTALLTDLLSH